MTLLKITLPVPGRTPITEIEVKQNGREEKISGLLNRDYVKFFNYIVNNMNDMIDESGCFKFPKFSDTTRPAPGVESRVFYNTDDGNLNIDNGVNWILPDGTIT